jgi:hypothetical protein
MNEIYQLQQILVKINHSLTKLFEIQTIFKFIQKETQDKFFDFLNDMFYVVLGQASEFSDLYNQDMNNQRGIIKTKEKKKKLKKSKHIDDVLDGNYGYDNGGDDYNHDIIDNIDPDDGGIENDFNITSISNILDTTALDHNNDNNKTSNFNFDVNCDSHLDLNNTIQSTQSFLFDSDFLTQLELDFDSLPLITTEGYSNWVENTTNRLSETTIVDITIDVVTIHKKTSNESHTAAIQCRDEFQSRTSNSRVDDDDDGDDDDDMYIYANYETGKINYQPNLYPLHQSTLHVEFGTNEQYLHNTTKFFQINPPNSSSSSPPLIPFSTTTIHLQHPTRYSNIYDGTTFYTISHSYTTILTQLDQIIYGLLLELNQKKIITQYLTAINHSDVEYDLLQLNQLGPLQSGNHHNGNSNEPTPTTVSLFSDTTTPSTHPTQQFNSPPILFLPLNQLDKGVNNDEGTNWTKLTNLSSPIGSNHIANNMSNNGIPPVNVKKLVQMLELDIHVAGAKREVLLHQIENIIRVQLNISE